MKKFLAFFLVFVSLMQFNASGQQKDTRRERLEREIRMLEQQYKEASTQSSDAMGRLQLVRSKMEKRRALSRQKETELRRINDTIYLVQRKINREQERLDTLLTYYSRLVKNAYLNRDSRTWFMYIMASENLGQAVRRYSYLKNISGMMTSQALKIKETKSLLDADLSRLKKVRDRAVAAKADYDREIVSLRSEEEQVRRMTTQLGRQKSKYQRQLSEKRRQMENLSSSVEKAVSSKMPVDMKLSGAFEANKGKLPWPCEGTVVERFGKHPHPVFSRITVLNNGVNIGVKKGTEVKCVYDGVVKKIIVMPGYNKCILVQHGGYFTFYCKLAAVSVKTGDKVRTGQKLGVSDVIGGESQVHFQLWKGNRPQNPEAWLR